MTIHEATNPRHTRVIDTNDAWWLADAWNERTFDWVVSEKEGNRFGFMLSGLTSLTRANLREALPDATWLAKLTQACFPSLPPVHESLSHLPYEAQVALAAESWTIANGDNGRVSTLRLAARNIMSLLPVTDGLLDPDVLFQRKPSGGAAGGWSLKYVDVAKVEPARPGRGRSMSDFLMGLAANPTLPSSSKPANPDTNMTTYRWMLSMALVNCGGSYEAKELLIALLKNPAATQADFEFFLAALDQTEAELVRRKEAKRARFDTTSFYKLAPVPDAASISSFRKAVAEHPNFVAWPSVDVAYPAGISLEAIWSDGLAATVDVKKSLFEESLADSLLRGRALKPRDTQESLVKLLLDNTKREVITERALSHIHAILNEEGDSTSLTASTRMLGVFSMTLGAIFSKLDEELESKDIPFEWFKEML